MQGEQSWGLVDPAQDDSEPQVVGAAGLNIVAWMDTEPWPGTGAWGCVSGLPGKGDALEGDGGSSTAKSMFWEVLTSSPMLFWACPAPYGLSPYSGWSLPS